MIDSLGRQQDECSIQAYHDLLGSGYFSRRRAQVLSMFVEFGPRLTGVEVAQHIENSFKKGKAKSEVVLNRISELFKMGLVQKVAMVPSPVTGETVTLWEWTGGRKPLRKLKTEVDIVRSPGRVEVLVDGDIAFQGPDISVEKFLDLLKERRVKVGAKVSSKRT